MTADNVFNHVQENGMNLQSNTVCLAQKASRSNKHSVRTASFEPKKHDIPHLLE